MTLPDDPNRILCYCLGVPSGIVEQAVREKGLKTVQAVTEETKAGGGCRSCHPEIREVIQKVRAETKGEGGLFARLFGRRSGRGE